MTFGSVKPCNRSSISIKPAERHIFVYAIGANDFRGRLTFALTSDVAVEFGHNVASRVLHQGFVDQLFVIVGARLLPKSADAGRGEAARMAGQLDPRGAPVLQ